ncbi:helix-hairpin-helix domain-containing protein [Devosia sp.]|uniref:helix-hairpin-helix domain-containing protein n=1 Tax=Devosia sp. TaxID=1871048 RepID=UPI001AC10D5F|nr:helix-hairpin-helix domain-containing protein [Devosia sp.]MBN9335632.1 hypothetical protein [Devosia sp.]
MDDLTKIKGIGNATAKRLAGAGIVSFATLAAALPEQFQAIEKLGGSPTEWADWVAGAKALVPTPVDLSQAAPEKIDAQAALIDAARDRLDAALARVDSLSAELGNGTNVDLEQSLDDAEAERDAAQRALDLLIGPGDIMRLDLGSDIAEASTDTTSSANEPNSTITPPSDDEGSGGDGGLEAVSTRQLEDDEDDEEDEVDLVADFGRALDALNNRIDRLAEESVEAALSFIGTERARFRMIIDHVTKLDVELQRHEREVIRTETVWPLTTVRLDGIDRPIGKPLKVDPVTFTALTSSGDAADHAPPEAEGVTS